MDKKLLILVSTVKLLQYFLFVLDFLLDIVFLDQSEHFLIVKSHHSDKLTYH
jgi:hypothetical protein